MRRCSPKNWKELIPHRADVLLDGTVVPRFAGGEDERHLIEKVEAEVVLDTVRFAAVDPPDELCVVRVFKNLDVGVAFVAGVAAVHVQRAQEVVRDALARVTAGGSTAIAPALERALAWLEASRPGARRQVLLLSDGRTSEADADRIRTLADAVVAVRTGAGDGVELIDRVDALVGQRLVRHHRVDPTALEVLAGLAVVFAKKSVLRLSLIVSLFTQCLLLEQSVLLLKPLVL